MYWQNILEYYKLKSYILALRNSLIATKFNLQNEDEVSENLRNEWIFYLNDARSDHIVITKGSHVAAPRHISELKK